MGAITAWLEEPRELVNGLHDAGFRVGVGEQLKLLRLLELLEHHGVTETAEQLTHWLSPVHCTRSDQVPRLRQVIDAQLPAVARRGSVRETIAPVTTLTAVRGAGPQDSRPAAGWRLPRPKPRTVLTWALALVALAAGLAALPLWFDNLRLLGSQVYRTMVEVAAPAVSVSLPDVLQSAMRSIGGAVFLGTLGLLVYRRTRLALRRARVIGEGRPITVELDPPADDSDHTALLRAARVLNRPTEIPTRRLDVAATVRATADAAGRFTPIPAVRRVPASWLLLVERGGPEDPLPAFGHRLSILLERCRVRHVMCEFQRSPEWVRQVDLTANREGNPRKGPHLRLERILAVSRPTHILMLAEAGRVIDDTGATARWIVENDVPTPIMLLTPNPQDNWGAAEARAAQAGVLVLTADEAGLSMLAHRLRAQDLEAAVLPPAQDETRASAIRTLYLAVRGGAQAGDSQDARRQAAACVRSRRVSAACRHRCFSGGSAGSHGDARSRTARSDRRRHGTSAPAEARPPRLVEGRRLPGLAAQGLAARLTRA